jgi:hypothetical protein
LSARRYRNYCVTPEQIRVAFLEEEIPPL